MLSHDFFLIPRCERDPFSVWAAVQLGVTGPSGGIDFVGLSGEMHGYK